MACEILTTLALTATLLGHQGLKVESKVVSPKAGVCLESQVELKSAGVPNAKVVLRNSRGENVYEENVRVATILFYDYGHSKNDGHNHSLGGAIPEKSATFLFKYPQTVGTLNATAIELKTFDGSFSQTAALQSENSKAEKLRVL